MQGLAPWLPWLSTLGLAPRFKQREQVIYQDAGHLQKSSLAAGLGASWYYWISSAAKCDIEAPSPCGTDPCFRGVSRFVENRQTELSP